MTIVVIIDINCADVIDWSVSRPAMFTPIESLRVKYLADK